MMTPADLELALAQASTAHRERTPEGEIRPHRIWHDLDENERVLAHDETDRLRALERATSSDGLSSTARAVLERIRRA